MLVLPISAATPFSWGPKECEEAEIRANWARMCRHTAKVSQGSWAGSSPCLCRDEGNRPSWTGVVSEMCTGRQGGGAVLIRLGQSCGFWSSSAWWFLFRALFLDSWLEGGRGDGEEGGDGIPEISQFPAFVPGALRMVYLYSSLNPHM